MTRHELHCIQDFLIEHVETIDFPSTNVSFKYLPNSVIDAIDGFVDWGDYAQRTHISPDYSLDDVITLLSDGLAEMVAFEDVRYDERDYSEARSKLCAMGAEKDLCLELVQAQMILDGKPIYLVEVDTHELHILTIDKIVKGLDMRVEQIMHEYSCNRMHAICVLLDEGDFYDYNAVLQLACFGEVVYG